MKKDVIIQANNEFRRFVLFCNIIFVPLGIMGGIALFAFLYDKHSEIGDIIGAVVTFISAIILFGYGIYFRNKKIYIKKDGLLVKGIFKKKYLSIQSLSKIEIINSKIKIYDYSGHKITQITGLYEGYDELREWISLNNITVEGKDVEM